MNRKQKKLLIRILSSLVLVILLILLPLEEKLSGNAVAMQNDGLLPVSIPVGFWLYLIPYLVIGYDILKKAWKGIRNRQVFDENFLMAVATIGAFALGDYREGVAVMLFYQTGELFQNYAVGKSRRSISDLMDIRPDYANVMRNGELFRVDPDEVEIGSVIVVKPGEKIPIDGVIVQGDTALDTAALTGESLPREVGEGDDVTSGCINISGLIHIQTSKAFGESTVSKILDLMENAGSKKARSENFISRFAAVYTPAVCFGALALAVLPPLVRLTFLHLAPQWGVWVYRALTFLVISCPCALVISIPLSFFAGIGGAGKEGILIKGSAFLETLSKIRCVVLDKTGTMTCGVFEVSGIHHNAAEEKKILEYAALAESGSSHPISQSLQRAYGQEPDMERVSDIRELSGHGVIAQVDGKTVAVGNSRLMEKLSVEYKDCHHVGTIVHVAVDGVYQGHILISDVVKSHAKEAVEDMKKAGVKKVIMLTGDAEPVAEHVGEQLEVSEVFGGLLPEDKVSLTEQFLSQMKDGEKLAFVGDGINDAPVLSRADVGIAMGGLGSDAAIEAADVVLMDDDPLKIAKTIRIARKCMRIVYENIYFAIGIKVLCLILGALGIANMWLAIFADVGVMVIAVLNAIRALSVRRV